MKKAIITITASCFLLVACQKGEEKADDTKTEAKTEAKADEKAPEKPAENVLRAAVNESVAACVKDKECMVSLKQHDALLTSCPWYEAVGCGVAVTAAVAACVVTEGEACAEALAAVAAIGCCNCIPAGPVQDMCKAL